MRRIDGKLPEEWSAPVRGKRSLLVNLLGILLAFVVAFGGLALVEGRLAAEEARLLEGGGEVDIPIQSHRMEAESVGEIELRQAGLTQEELVQAVGYLESGGETYLHEPQEGQLIMAQAVECGKAWMEEFLLPRLGLEADAAEASREYRAGCFLWAREENSSADVEAPWLSYWSVSLSCPGIDARLILDAATGQVLNATISCTYPIEYQKSETVEKLLGDYADSFGIEPFYTILGQDGEDWKTYRGLGNGKIEAFIGISNIVVATTEDGSGTAEYKIAQDNADVFEYVYIRLYLETMGTADGVP